MSDSIEGLPENVAAALDEFAPVELTPEQVGPSYKIDPTSKVPVSKAHGKLWKARIDAACRTAKLHVDSWDECIKYYNNSQQDHRTDSQRADMSGNRYFSARRNKIWSETENMVYSNTRAIIPALYAKNPQVEFTCSNEEYRNFIQSVEDVVNTLASMRTTPGLNLKVHAKQAVIAAELTNLAWLEIGYVQRDQSSLGVQEKLDMLAEELLNAEDTKTIVAVEGKLMALEEELDVLTPPGPFVQFHPPHAVINDPDCVLPDFSDAKWRAVKDFYPTAYLNAKYAEKNEEGQYMSLYEPTHVFLAGESKDQDDISSFKLFNKEQAAHEYGYASNAELKKAERTMCWRVYDKTTRRVYLYADNKWDWPIWVENDPYSLPNFFTSEPMYFNTTPMSAYSKSNVAYYLDQQDAINEIHDEFRRARQDIKENILYDAKFDRTSVEAWLKGSSGNAQGVNVPEGKSLKDMILEKPNAMLRAAPLFDLARPMQSIDRISGVSDVLRNVQFKTNTTNKAIENYNSSTAQRLDEKIDAIEDCLGRVLYAVGFLCAQFMTPEQAMQLVGQKAEGWTQRPAKELQMMFQCQAIGGSTQKPTSAAKKQQALEMADVLSKLGQFAPTVVAETILTLFNGAFDELELPAGAFQRIQEEAQAVLQRGNSVQGAQGGPAPEGPDVGAAPSSNVNLAEVAAIIDGLPPAAKTALGTAIAQGVPIAEAVPEIVDMLSNATQQGM